MRIVTMILLSFFCVSCAQPLPVSPTPHFSHWSKNPMRLDVKHIVFENVDVNRGDEEEFFFPVGLEQSVRLWREDRLLANHYNNNTLTIEIIESSITKKDLPTQTGLADFFFIEQAEELGIKLKVNYTLSSAYQPVIAQGGVSINRKQTVPENASIQEQEIIWVTLLENTINDLDTLSEKVFREKLNIVQGLNRTFDTDNNSSPMEEIGPSNPARNAEQIRQEL